MIFSRCERFPPGTWVYVLNAERRAEDRLGCSDQPRPACTGRHHRTIMTFKIKAADLKSMAEGLDVLSAERARLGDAVGVFNEALATARATLQAAVDDYNQKAKDARAL